MLPMIYLDFETRSNIDISVGSYRYASSPSTTIICAVWALDRGEDPDEPLEWHVWTPTGTNGATATGLDEGEEYTHHDGAGIPKELCQLANGEIELCAANVEFELAILKYILNIDVPSEVCHDPSALGSYFRLPGSLAKQSAILGTGAKDDDGKGLIRVHCQPDRHTGFLTDLPDFMVNEFVAYCIQDVRLLIANHNKLTTGGMFPCREMDVFRWHLDVNRRGIPIDTKLLDACIKMRPRVIGVAPLPSTFPREKLTSVVFVRSWLASRNIATEDLRKETLEALLVKGRLPADVKLVIEARLSIAKASLDKLDAIEASIMPDGTIKGGHRYYHTGTGRWGGGGVQVQNMPKSPYGISVQGCIDAVLAGDEKKLNELTKGKPSAGLVACMRPLITAPKGYSFISFDYATVEARWALWYARDEKHLQMLRDGVDLYCVMATRLFGRPITKADTLERDIGKRAVLSCCMQIGGDRFEEDCKVKYALDLTTVGLNGKKVVDAFRSEFPALSAKSTGLWWLLQNAVLQAVKKSTVEHVAGCVVYVTAKGHLAIKLPSGRVLYHRDVRLEDGEFGPRVIYNNWSPKIQGYLRDDLYGGKLCDFLAQSTASDLLRSCAMILSQQSLVLPVMHVHDSLITTCPTDRIEEGKKILTAAAMSLPTWAHGFPLKIDLEITQRFQKAE